MGNWFSKLLGSNEPEILTEDIKAFNNKGNNRQSDKQRQAESGEGIDIMGMDMGVTGLSSFNTFYNKFFDEQNKTNDDRIRKYRSMASMPEIGDVLEDAVNESTQENGDGNIFELHITNEKMSKNENIIKTLKEEFHSLFFQRLDMNQQGWELFYNFMRDGKVYYERIININKHKEGIKHIKFLSPFSMDYYFNYDTYRIEGYIQYMKPSHKKPATFEDAKRDNEIVAFIPEQIGYIPYRFGNNRNDVYGYLENCKVAFNQLKLLETSVIVYRLVRAPERFVFKIDVGNMPKDKALAYVNKIKRQMNRKQTYDPETGVLEGTTNVNCIRQNTEIKLLDGRCLPLTDIIDEFNQGKENWVYSINQKTFKMEPNKITNAAITRKNEELVRIHLDDGSYFDTTHDHKWIMRDGSERRADELNVYDSLMPLNEDLPDVVNHKVAKIEYLTERDDTGCITVENNHNFAITFNLSDGSKSQVYVKNSILDNLFIPQSDNRGSDVTTIGGNSAGFTELDDVEYFAKKLYRSLKYPMSRIDNQMDSRSGDNLFGGASFSEITRDEIKWSRFLERQQNKFCLEFLDLFLLHLEFKGLKKQYGLTRDDLNILMSPPSNYKDQQNQQLLETRFNNYTALSNESEFSKSYLMKKYLDMDEEAIKENSESMKADKKLFPKDEDNF